MKKFSFRFASLLVLRKQEEEKLLADYSVILKKYNESLAEKETVNQQIKDLLEKKKQFLSTGQASVFSGLLSQLKDRLVSLKELLEKIKLEMEPWKKKLIEKKKDIKVLQNLKAKDHTEYTKKKFKKEQSLLEESYTF